MVSHTLQKWGCTQPYTSVARNPKKVFCTLLKCCCNRTSKFSRNNKISRITIFAKITTSYFHKDCQIHQMYRNPDSPKSLNSPESKDSTEPRHSPKSLDSLIYRITQLTKITRFNRIIEYIRITKLSDQPNFQKSHDPTKWPHQPK